jgi:hypothetical protein|tara:strand:+ start:476 stop:955 length:480 start_codon:yes stop_codon:yes gene_type:complete
MLNMITLIGLGYEPDDGLTYFAFALAMILFFIYSYLSEFKLPYKFFGVKKEDLYGNGHDGDLGDMEDWDVICRMAVEQAKRGDHRAREWVVKHMIDNQEDVFGQFDQPDQDKEIVEDAITALCSVGYKKAEAKKVIESLLQDRTYDSVEELTKDALSKR